MMNYLRSIFSKFSTQDYLYLAVLLGIALGVRALHYVMEPYGDETLYVYLGETFGIGTDRFIWGDDLRSHVAYRPLLYSILWLFSWGGIEGMRWFMIVVGTINVGLVYTISRKLNIAPLWSAVAGTFAALHGASIGFSAIVFPDAISTCITLFMVLAALHKRYVLASFLALAATLTKEMFIVSIAILGFLFLLDIWPQTKKAGGLWQRIFALIRTRKAWWFILPILGLAVTQYIGLAVFDGKPQGWSSRNFALTELRDILIWIGAILMFAWLIIRKQWKALAIGLPFQLFFLAWIFIFNRGTEVWYTLITAASMSVIISATLQEIWRALLQITKRKQQPPFDSVTWKRWRPYIIWILFAIGAAWYTVSTPLYHMEWSKTDISRKILHETVQHQALDSLLKEQNPQQMATIGCFWSHSYYYTPQSVPQAFHVADAFDVIGEETYQFNTQGHIALAYSDIVLACDSPAFKQSLASLSLTQEQLDAAHQEELVFPAQIMSESIFTEQQNILNSSCFERIGELDELPPTHIVYKNICKNP